METNLGIALLAARCAGVDLNTEIDELIALANAKHDKRGPPLFEPITSVWQQLIAHQDLRECLVGQVAIIEGKIYLSLIDSTTRLL